MAHAQKPDFVFRRKGRVYLNRRGASVQSTTGKRGVRISGSNAGYTMFRSSVKSTGYPLHSPVSSFLSRASPCAIIFQLDSTAQRWLPTTFASFPLHFPTRASPCAITFQLDSIYCSILYWEPNQPTKELPEGGDMRESASQCPLVGVAIHALTALLGSVTDT
jgi:hypothetical protein